MTNFCSRFRTENGGKDFIGVEQGICSAPIVAPVARIGNVADHKLGHDLRRSVVFDGRHDVVTGFVKPALDEFLNAGKSRSCGLATVGAQ